jgi:ABC-type polysaccharide/polyol phosphate export permease
MTILFKHLLGSFSRPDHWVYGSWLDTVMKYRKTRLGVVWLLVPTAVYIWGIGGFIASLQPGLDTAKFLAHVAVGYSVFRMISAVLSDATSVFSTYQYYIYDGNLRLTDFVLRNLTRSFYYFLACMPLVLAVAIASPAFNLSGLPLALLGLAILLINLFSYSVMLGMAGARFQDLSELMGSVMMAAFLVTPVVWYPDAAPEGSVAGILMRANPFHHLLVSVRAPVLGEAIEPATYVYLAAMTVVGILGAAVIYRGSVRRVPLWL